MTGFLIIGVVLVAIAIVGFITNVSGPGASLIGLVVAETIAIPIAVVGAVLIIVGLVLGSR